MHEEEIFQELLKRQAGAPGRSAPAMTDAEIDKWQAENAPLYRVGKAMEPAIDALLTALGLQEQKPGDLPTAVGAALGLGVAGMPPRLAKELGKRTVDAIQHPAIKRAFANLQELYPRLMGHVDRVVVGRLPSVPGGGVIRGEAVPRFKQTDSNFGFVDKFLRAGPLKKDRKAAARYLKQSSIVMNPEGPTIPRTAAHELTHVAQNLRDIRYPDKYLIESMVKGYDRNPFEIRARAGGVKFDKLQELADQANMSPKELLDLRRQVRQSPRMREFRAVPKIELDLPMDEQLKAMEMIDQYSGMTPEELLRQLVGRSNR